MSTETMPDTAASTPAPASYKPATKRFRKTFNAVRPSPDQARRQGAVTRLAWDGLGGREAVMAFLNTHDDALGGRPLDLAVASDAGLVAVERAIADRASASAPRDALAD